MKRHLQFAAGNNFKFCCFFKINKYGMVFHMNRLLADDSHEISYLIFFQKLGKMSQNLSSAAIVIGVLTVFVNSWNFKQLVSYLTSLHTFKYYPFFRGKLGPKTFSFRGPAQNLGALGYWAPVSLFPCATQSVQSTPADNTWKRVWQYIEKEKTRLHCFLYKCRRAKIFYCASRESNPGCWIYRQTLYHVAVIDCFYRKAVEVYYIYLDPVTFNPSNLKFVPEFLGTGITWNETNGDIYAQNGHRMGYLRWAPLF